MRKNLNIARNLGYVDIPEHEIVSPGEAAQLEPHQVLALCTGSQGEPMSALTRIAYGDHPALTVEPGDTVIISAKPVPGTSFASTTRSTSSRAQGRRSSTRRSRRCTSRGTPARRSSGRCSPCCGRGYVMPIHGEYRMLAAHAKLAREAGVPEDRIILADNGSVVELARGGARLVDQVDAGVTFVDGLRVGDVQDVALRDRRRLADDGVLIVVTTLASSDGGEIAPPELIARGFAESDELLDELRTEADRVVRELATQHVTEIKLLQEHIHDAIGQVVYDRTRRRPMVLPVVIEV